MEDRTPGAITIQPFNFFTLFSQQRQLFLPELDEPDGFAPACEIWTSRARPWERLLPGVPHFDESFDNAWLRERLRPRPAAP